MSDAHGHGSFPHGRDQRVYSHRTKSQTLKTKEKTSNLTQSEFSSYDKGHNKDKEIKQNSMQHKRVSSKPQVGENLCELLTSHRLLAQVRARKEDSPEENDSTCHGQLLGLQLHTGTKQVFLEPSFPALTPIPGKIPPHLK